MSEATAHRQWRADRGMKGYSGCGTCEAHAKVRPVTTKHLGIAAAIAGIDMALLLVVGAAMWSEAPFPAEEAVGKGLVALGAALAVPAFVLVCAFLNARATERLEEEKSRSDSDVI